MGKGLDDSTLARRLDRHLELVTASIGARDDRAQRMRLERLVREEPEPRQALLLVVMAFGQAMVFAHGDIDRAQRAWANELRPGDDRLT